MANKVETLKNSSGDNLYPLCSGILTDTIDTNAFANAAVTSAKLPTQIPIAKFKDSGIGSDDLATDSVGTSRIADGAINSAKIADGNVTTAKIADLGVGTNDFAANAVTSAKMSRENNAITFTFKLGSTTKTLTGRRISLGGNLYMYVCQGTVALNTSANDFVNVIVTFPAFTTLYAYYIHYSCMATPQVTTCYTNADSTSQIQAWVWANVSNNLMPTLVVVGQIN